MPFYDAIRVGASGAAESFKIERSLRFDSASSTYLGKTPSTVGNRKKWTWSAWVKRSKLGAVQDLFSAYHESGFYNIIRFGSDDQLNFQSNSAQIKETNRVFRDVSAWYHIVVSVNTLNTTAADRVIIYVNGSRETLATDNTVNFGIDFAMNSAQAHTIGVYANGSSYNFDGYIAEINFIDGEQLTPASFGETDSTTGQWNPIEYEGTYTKSGTQNDGSTFISGSTASNNLSAANSFNGTPTSSGADAGSMYQTPLNGSYTVTLDHAIVVSSQLRLQGYFSNANFNQYSSFFVNGVEQTVANTPISGTENGTNSGVFEVSYTGTINNYSLQSHPTSITGIAQFIVDGEVLINGFNDNGKNSFYLQFADNSGATATTLGKDTSGQSNNYTPNNFSVASGKEGDSFADTPTNNFCTLNPLVRSTNSAQALLDGNLTRSGSSHKCVGTFILENNKYYFEMKAEDANGNHAIGVCQHDTDMRTRVNTEAAAYFAGSGGEYKIENNAQTSGMSAYGNGDIIGIAIDTTLSTPKIWFAKNNSWQLSGDPANGTNGLSLTAGKKYVPTYDHGSSSSSTTGTAFFGAHMGEFNYTPPTGFVAASSANLPVPTILLPNKHFDTLLYTGNGGSHSITGLEFQPDWLWIKNRGQADNHQLHDAVRGPSKGLHSNSSAAEFTDANAVTAFNSNGFSMNNNYDSHNKSSETYVAWNWDAGATDGKTYTVTVVDDSGNKYRFDGFGTSAVTLDLAEGGTYIFNYPSAHPFRFSTTADGTHGGGSEYTTGVTVLSSTSIQIVVAASAPNLNYFCSSHSGMGGAINTNSTLGSSNFDGGIQSTVKANTTSGFSIVTYTGNGSAGATVGHGLGVIPEIVIVKRRNSADDWRINIGPILGSGKEGHSVKWNSTGGEADTNNLFNSTNPTSTVFTIGDSTDLNGNGSTYLAYCFSGVAFYSKFDKYTGNGSDDGTFVFTGFRPAWLLMKNVSSGSTNFILKTAKIQNNVMLAALQSNRPDAEQSSLSSVDFLSNGFKIRNTGSFTNTNGDTYIYWCFAESPFKNSRAR